MRTSSLAFHIKGEVGKSRSNVQPYTQNAKSHQGPRQREIENDPLKETGLPLHMPRNITSKRMKTENSHKLCLVTLICNAPGVVNSKCFWNLKELAALVRIRSSSQFSPAGHHWLLNFRGFASHQISHWTFERNHSESIYTLEIAKYKSCSFFFFLILPRDPAFELLPAQPCPEESWTRTLNG